MRNAKLIREVKLAARDKFAWPGGYPLFILMHDCECLCVKCAKGNFALIARATRDEAYNQTNEWIAEFVGINWEDSGMFCAHCGQQIPSAYGDD